MPGKARSTTVCTAAFISGVTEFVAALIRFDSTSLALAASTTSASISPAPESGSSPGGRAGSSGDASEGGNASMLGTRADSSRAVGSTPIAPASVERDPIPPR